PETPEPWLRATGRRWTIWQNPGVASDGADALLVVGNALRPGHATAADLALDQRDAQVGHRGDETPGQSVEADDVGESRSARGREAGAADRIDDIEVLDPGGERAVGHRAVQGENEVGLAEQVVTEAECQALRNVAVRSSGKDPVQVAIVLGGSPLGHGEG